MTYINTTEEFDKIQGLCREIMQCTRKGTLDAHLVLATLEGVIEGKYPKGLWLGNRDPEGELPKVPTLSPALWAQVVKAQEFLHQYGGEPGFHPEDAALAVPPAGVPEDELLLVVYLPDRGGKSGFFRTLDAWFNFADQERPAWRNPKLRAESTVMRLATEYQPGVRWVRFRRNHDAGKSPSYSRERVIELNGQLGGLEPLIAVSLVKDYCDSWYEDGNVAPNLSGIEVSLDGGETWDSILYLIRWDDTDQRRLDLGVGPTGCSHQSWGSPLVTEYQNPRSLDVEGP